MVEYYYTFKVIHIISIISWMAGLLYLPRIYVYHSNAKSIDTKNTFLVMEKKLLSFIMNPAAILSIITGTVLIFCLDLPIHSSGWLHMKFLLVLGMIFCHLYMYILHIAFRENRSNKSHIFFRIFNEVPTILMIFIVILVVVKPF